MDLKVVLDVWWVPQDTTNMVIIEAIQDLAHGRLDPDGAAHKIDEAIFSAERGVVRNDDGICSVAVPDDPEHLSYRRGFLLQLLPRVVAQIPADHPGQDRLVELLKSIPSLPERQIAVNWGDGTQTENLWAREKVNDYQKHLTFMESRVFGFMWKWKCPGGPYDTESDAPRPSLENYAAFCARLFVAGIYSLEGCAIGRAPFATINHSRALPDDYDEHACAAAQWIIFAGAELSEVCAWNAQPGPRWKDWDSWRVKFQAISEAENSSEHCRELADRTLRIMGRVEEDDVTTGGARGFGMSYQDGDTIVSTNPEARNYVGKKDQWDEYGQDGLSDNDE
ncbi:hypothetical protein CLAFUW4_11787 [Fulvia fulva]|uniref:Uncharacterized protein n=1 Tax=Passalora fulva TaxID=5499 RepID=A0A9Q8US75_PASFU|nr:uncharacterized protein CLAFUR5_10831 [Fulvia fulva]KAK4617611.1 hypothetical protein CLAFUR4_11792 [Fulvia fulva]KAK4618766.1 hypothetical protein CLAFUR0_11805 [Fulvia fulva]UJO20559.1 hypothetical protein CLAFUR5_10831 [Fulvia fulva]WPV18538.1 hypothetical protein CLAFUW4_11787 [Fulvia fulva]WPV33053.1 hypothetical protein CLAFUW7_11794 [Fulvia fulva]